MKFLSKSLALLVTLTMLAPALAKSDKCHEKEVVKYVQGGAPAPGNGTKEHPFATLQNAQKDPSWDVLIVLSSKVPLTDGIILANRKLIGEENPTCISFSQTQPTLTTLGVTVVGNSVIENLYIKDTTGSAINYDKAENLTVKNVLITGFNKENSGAVAGIQGNSSSPGETIVEHTIIRNNNGTTGVGISDIPVGVSRKLTVCNCTFSALTNTGINSVAAGLTTLARIVIRDSYFHDFNGTTGTGVSFNANFGGQVTALVKDSSFSNIVTASGGDHISTGAFSVSGSSVSDLKVKIDRCSFEEVTTLDSSAAILAGNDSSISEIIVENSVSMNLAFFFQSIVNHTAVQKNRLCGNTVTGSVFYGLYNTNTGTLTPVEITDIRGNLFTGGQGISFQEINPWKLLKVTAEHNCFTGTQQSDAFIAGKGNAGNADIFAHKNSFIGFSTDIFDSGSNINYQVSKNFWGHTPAIPCTGGVCSSPYQVCKNNVCLGPIVAIAPIFTGFIDASDPLEESIKCPNSFCREEFCK